MSKAAERLRRHGFALVLAIALCVFWYGKIDRQQICCDAHDNLRMAVSLAHEGVLSLAVDPPFEPTLYREPLPPVLSAGLIKAVEAVAGQAPFHVYQDGDRTAWLKYQNLFWMLLLTVGASLLSSGERRARPRLHALPDLYPGHLSVPGDERFRDQHLFTEIVATGILVAASCLYGDAVRDGSRQRALLSGLLLGMLVLIKAVFLPVVVVLVLVTPLIWRITGWAPGRDRRLVVAGAILLGVVVIVSPWLVRNRDSVRARQGK